MTTATTKVEVNGQTLTARVWQLLHDAYTAAGLNPKDCVVTQGSWHHGALSGSTHDGGGAFDLRVWNIPASKHGALVVELRRRNVCAWKRDQAHGGFDPHIHGIVRDEAGLSAGATWQVAEYDRKHDGLSARGPDYHPRPVQSPFVFVDPTIPVPAKPVVRLSELRFGRSSGSALIVSQALVAEGLVSVARSLWNPFGNAKALRLYRTRHGFGKDTAGAVQSLGREHGFDTIP